MGKCNEWAVGQPIDQGCTAHTHTHTLSHSFWLVITHNYPWILHQHEKPLKNLRSFFCVLLLLFSYFVLLFLITCGDSQSRCVPNPRAMCVRACARAAVHPYAHCVWVWPFSSKRKHRRKVCEMLKNTRRRRRQSWLNKHFVCALCKAFGDAAQKLSFDEFNCTCFFRSLGHSWESDGHHWKCARMCESTWEMLSESNLRAILISFS